MSVVVRGGPVGTGCFFGGGGPPSRIAPRDHQPPTAANRQRRPTANRQSPPTMVEHISYTWSFCKTAVQGRFFFSLKAPLVVVRVFVLLR